MNPLQRSSSSFAPPFPVRIGPNPVYQMALSRAKKSSLHFDQNPFFNTDISNDEGTSTPSNLNAYRDERNRRRFFEILRTYAYNPDAPNEEIVMFAQLCASVLWNSIPDMWALHGMADDSLYRFEQFVVEKDEYATVTQEVTNVPLPKLSPLFVRLMEPDYRSRIEGLRVMANDEGFTAAQASIDDFWLLIRTLMPTRKAQLVLTDDGNLIAIWDNDDGNYVDVEFLGDGSLHYLIFKGTEHSPDRKCEEGGGDIHTVKRQVHEHKLESLLGI